MVEMQMKCLQGNGCLKVTLTAFVGHVWPVGPRILHNVEIFVSPEDGGALFL
jgi:hypothetical protein